MRAGGYRPFGFSERIAMVSNLKPWKRRLPVVLGIILLSSFLCVLLAHQLLKDRSVLSIKITWHELDGKRSRTITSAEGLAKVYSWIEVHRRDAPDVNDIGAVFPAYEVVLTRECSVERIRLYGELSRSGNRRMYSPDELEEFWKVVEACSVPVPPNNPDP